MNALAEERKASDNDMPVPRGAPLAAMPEILAGFWKGRKEEQESEAEVATCQQLGLAGVGLRVRACVRAYVCACPMRARLRIGLGGDGVKMPEGAEEHSSSSGLSAPHLCLRSLLDFVVTHPIGNRTHKRASSTTQKS